MTTVTKPIRFESRGRHKRAVVGTASEPDRSATVGRVPRVARLMALAIRYDRLLRDGVVSNQSELARLAHVTQPRMTQIMNMLHLAPDIQEAVLTLPPVRDGHESVTERTLRPISGLHSWSRQRAAWNGLGPRATTFDSVQGLTQSPKATA